MTRRGFFAGVAAAVAWFLPDRAYYFSLWVGGDIGDALQAFEVDSGRAKRRAEEMRGVRFGKPSHLWVERLPDGWKITTRTPVVG